MDANGNAVSDKPAPIKLYDPEAKRHRPDGTIDLESSLAPSHNKEFGINVLKRLVSGVEKMKVEVESENCPDPVSFRKPDPHGRSVKDLCNLQIASLDGVMKVLPGSSSRVYSIGFHPTVHKVIGIIGGRYGHLSLWCPFPEGQLPKSEESTTTEDRKAAAQEAKELESHGDSESGRVVPPVKEASASTENDDNEEKSSSTAASGKKRKKRGSGGDAGYSDSEEEDPMRRLCVFDFHTATVNSFLTPMECPNQIVTTSYDGSIRILDLHQLKAFELYDDYQCPSGITAETYTSGGFETGASFWVANRKGGMYHLDTRTRDGSTDREAVVYSAHSKKITSISAHAGQPLVVTASMDGVAKVWDVRNMKRDGAGAIEPAEVKPLAELKHDDGVTSAFFSKSGKHMVTCADDNKLRVWSDAFSTGTTGLLAKGGKLSVAKSAPPPTHSIFHDNHTGIWITRFKCTWDPANDDTFVIGNMKRAVQLFSATTGEELAYISHELLTAIPTQNAIHPKLNCILSGTASGRAYCWS